MKNQRQSEKSLISKFWLPLIFGIIDENPTI